MIFSNLIFYILVFVLSLFTTTLIIKFVHPILINYTKIPAGPQKIHNGLIPRLGGLSIFICLSIVCIVDIPHNNLNLNSYLIISLPLFLLGIIEDITQSVKPIIRLIGALLSSFIFIIVFDVFIKKVDVYWIDLILNYKQFAILFTIICLVVLTQAFNIIDGLNGLSLMSGIVCLSLLAFLAEEFGDNQNFSISIILIITLFGILLFNFFGKIFIGDSGAYIIGLFVGMLSIKLVESNSEIIPLAIVYILIYPIYEIIRTVFRRFIQNKNILLPDTKHLHSLLHEMNMYKFSQNTFKSNLLASAQIILILVFNAIIFTLIYDNFIFIFLCIIFFIFQYEMIYLLAKKFLMKQVSL